MKKTLTLTVTFVVVGFGGLAAQDRQSEVFTDYPILKTGVFANYS
jgi:hypothetical protein